VIVKPLAASTALCAIVGLAGVPVALAQPEGELPADGRARTLLEEGLAAYEARDYTRAIAAFERGHAIEARRVFLFAWAQAERLSGRCDRASPLYRRFLEEQPPEEQAARAREGLVRCAAEPGPERAPAVDARARPQPRPRPPPPRRTGPFWTDPVGDVLGGTGLAAFVASAVLLGVAEGAAVDAGHASSLGEWEDRADGARSGRLWAGIAAGAGAILVAAAIVRFATHDRGEVSPQAASGGLVLATWRP
jgi:tetratricopeptide (TPR) repeat protein